MSNTHYIKPITIAISLCFVLGAYAPTLKAAEDAQDQARRMLQPAIFITTGNPEKQIQSSALGADPQEQARRVLQPPHELLVSHAPVEILGSSPVVISSYDSHKKAQQILQKSVY